MGIDYVLPEKQLQALFAGELEDAPFPVLVGGFDRVFLIEALRGVQRATQAKVDGDSTGEAGGTAAAILLSAAACEAWFSEYLAAIEMVEGPQANVVELRSERNAQEQFKKLLKLKGSTYDCGCSTEYRQLGCLIKLRDHVAHRTARFMPVSSWPERLQDCMTTGVIPVREPTGMDWTSVIYEYNVGRWAVGAAARWLKVVAEQLPRMPHHAKCKA
jgi:hypothetical protein